MYTEGVADLELQYLINLQLKDFKNKEKLFGNWNPWLLRNWEKDFDNLVGVLWLMEINIQSFKGLLLAYLVWHVVILYVN